MIRQLFCVSIFVLCILNIKAQTYSWSGYVAGSTSYTTGIMTSTVTSSSPGFQNSTPKYYSGNTVGSGQCGITGGLALEDLFGNITAAHATITMSFTNGNTTNGTCASIQFQIMDINADESVQTFRDFVYVSAIDGNNIAVPVANITATGGSNKSITTSGSSRVIAGSSGSYGSRGQTACDNVTITVTPPAGTPLKSITLKYQPSYETCANCYYNWTGPNRPAYQYISISSLTGTATGGGCTVLPVEITSFDGKCEGETKKLEWTTATETNNRFFNIEGSTDGEDFKTLGKVNGAGNSSVVNHYEWELKDESSQWNYFRLKQEDTDGKLRGTEIIALKCQPSFDISLYPNPANQSIFLSSNEEIELDRIEVYDLTGRLVMQKNYSGTDSRLMELNIADLSPAYYMVGFFNKENSMVKSIPFVKD